MSATLTVRIAADINSFSRALTKVEKDFVRAAKRIESAGKAMSVAVTAPLLAMGAAFAKSAADDAASVERLKRVFGGAASEMEGFIKQVMKTIPATDDALREMTGTTQNFLTQLGIAPKSATAMTQTLTKLAADMAAFNKVDMGTAMDALEKGLAGKTKGLTSLGVVISEQMIKQEAYRLGLAKVGGALSQSATAHATLSLVTQKMGNQMGEAARTAGDASKSWGFFKQSVDNLSDSMGTALVPAMSGGLKIITGAANRISEMGTTAKTTVVIFGGLAAAIGPLLVGLGSLSRAIVTLRATALGLGGTLGAGGAVIVGLGLLAYLLSKSGEAARNAKADADNYKSSLIGLTAAQLKWQQIQANMDIKIAKSNLAATPKTVRTGSRAGWSEGRNPAFEEATAQLKRAEAAAAAVKHAMDALADSKITPWIQTTANDITKITVGFNQFREAAERVREDANKEKKDWWRSYIEKTNEALSLTEQLSNAAMAMRPSIMEVMQSLSSFTIPDVSIPDVGLNDGLTKEQIKQREKMGILIDDSNKNANKLHDAIWGSATQLANTLVSSLNIGGGGKGSSLGGAIGATAGFVAGSFIPIPGGQVVGQAIGSLLGNMAGSFLGGLFDRQKEAINTNTAAVRALTQSMQLNSPSGFKIEPYRFNASDARPYGRRPSAGSGSGDIVFTGPVSFHGVQDLKELGRQVRANRARGGVNPLAA